MEPNGILILWFTDLEISALESRHFESGSLARWQWKNPWPGDNDISFAHHPVVGPSIVFVQILTTQRVQEREQNQVKAAEITEKKKTLRSTIGTFHLHFSSAPVLRCAVNNSSEMSNVVKRLYYGPPFVTRALHYPCVGVGAGAGAVARLVWRAKHFIDFNRLESPESRPLECCWKAARMMPHTA